MDENENAAAYGAVRKEYDDGYYGRLERECRLLGDEFGGWWADTADSFSEEGYGSWYREGHGRRMLLIDEWQAAVDGMKEWLSDDGRVLVGPGRFLLPPYVVPSDVGGLPFDEFEEERMDAHRFFESVIADHAAVNGAGSIERDGVVVERAAYLSYIAALTHLVAYLARMADAHILSHWELARFVDSVSGELSDESRSTAERLASSGGAVCFPTVDLSDAVGEDA